MDVTRFISSGSLVEADAIPGVIIAVAPVVRTEAMVMPCSTRSEFVPSSWFVGTRLASHVGLAREFQCVGASRVATTTRSDVIVASLSWEWEVESIAKVPRIFV